MSETDAAMNNSTTARVAESFAPQAAMWAIVAVCVWSAFAVFAVWLVTDVFLVKGKKRSNFSTRLNKLKKAKGASAVERLPLEGPGSSAASAGAREARGVTAAGGTKVGPASSSMPSTLGKASADEEQAGESSDALIAQASSGGIGLRAAASCPDLPNASPAGMTGAGKVQLLHSATDPSTLHPLLPGQEDTERGLDPNEDMSEAPSTARTRESAVSEDADACSQAETTPRAHDRDGPAGSSMEAPPSRAVSWKISTNSQEAFGAAANFLSQPNLFSSHSRISLEVPEFDDFPDLPLDQELDEQFC